MKTDCDQDDCEKASSPRVQPNLTPWSSPELYISPGLLKNSIDSRILAKKNYNLSGLSNGQTNKSNIHKRIELFTFLLGNLNLSRHTRNLQATHQCVATHRLATYGIGDLDCTVTKGIIARTMSIRRSIPDTAGD